MGGSSSGNSIANNNQSSAHIKKPYKVGNRKTYSSVKRSEINDMKTKKQKHKP